MKPKESDYLFFMLNNEGTHDFAATYDKHLTNIRAFRVYQKEKKKIKEKNKVRTTQIKSLTEKILLKNKHVNIDWKKVSL